MDASILKSHQFKDTLTTNPHDRSSYKFYFSEKDRDEWLELRDKLLEDIESQLIEIDGQQYLPKGTMLYHGSLEYLFFDDKKLKDKMTFFGLDTTISLWYILELIEDLQYKLFKKEYPRFGYLYAFRLKENLPVTKIIKTIHTSVYWTRHCRRDRDSVCIHPQISFRGAIHDYTPDIYNISIELTLFYNHYKDYLELDSVYLVDPLALKINATQPEFEPQMAILQKIDEYRDEYDQKIDKKTYNRYYGQSDWYTCEYDCGYKGTYDEVLEHEKTCSKRTQKGSGLEKRKNTRKKKMKVNKYTRLIQQKQNGKLTKKKSKWLDKRLQNKLCKCIKGLKSSKKKKRYKKGSEYPICLSSIYTKRGFKPPKLAIKSCKKK